jgi:DNA-binding CsgD family transcriptional regulator/tetratricopeptide (TPR) repeat protein
MYGVAADRDELADRLEESRTRRAVAFVLRGAPGTGRSVLLESLTRAAEGWRLVRFSAAPAEAQLPLAGLSLLLRSVAGVAPECRLEAHELLRRFESEEPSELPARYNALLDLLQDETDPHHPILFVIDDAHHLDGVSAACLTFVARRLERPGLAMIFSVRTGAAPRVEQSGLPTFQTGALSPFAAAELVRSRTGRRASISVARTLLEHVDGHPGGLLEASAKLTDQQLAGWTALPAPLPTVRSVAPPALEEAFPEETGRALALTALARSSDTRMLSRALQLADLSLEALEAAESAGIVHLHGRNFEFRTSLARSTHAFRSAPAERRRMHGFLAQAAAEIFPSDLDTRAHHLAAAGGDSHDELLVLHLAIADEAQAAGDPLRSARACVDAAHDVLGGQERGILLLRAAHLAQDAGLNDWTRHLLDLVFREDSSEAVRFEAREARGYAQLTGGAALAALRPLGNGGEELSSSDPQRAARLFATATVAAVLSGRLDAAEAAARRGHELAVPGTPEAALVATALGVVESMSGEAGSEAAALGDHLTVLSRHGGGIETVYLRSIGQLARIWNGEVDDARRELQQLVSELESAGRNGLLPLPLACLATAEYRCGWWDAAIQHAARSRELAEASGQLPLAGEAHAVIARVAAARGQVEQARMHVAAARRIAASGDAEPLLGHAAAAEGLLELGTGSPENAVLLLEEARQVASRCGIRASSVLSCVADLLLAYVEAGKPADAQRLLHELEEEAHRSASTSLRSIVHRGHALLGSEDDALASLSRSSALLVPWASPFEEARNRLLAAVLALGRGRYEEAGAGARLARLQFATLGASPWAERAQRVIDTVAEPPAPAPSGGTSALTPQEHRVSRLVAEGRSNREVAEVMVISRKTVEYHLHHVYQKLGLSSRSQLIRRLVGEDDEDGAERAG